MMIQQQSRTWKQVEEPGQREEPAGYYSQCTEFVASNPGLSVAIGLGVGLAAGLVVACVMRGSTSEENLAERIGHRVSDSVRDVIPSSWKKALRS
jgi:hypothetical protein